MSPTIGLPPPEPETCLVTSRVSRYKGGTLVEESVADLETHVRRVRDPDGYRPVRCPRCGHPKLHAHGYAERHPRGEVGGPVAIVIALYICASPTCGATWRILPSFLARHLWRVWSTVERVTRLGEAATPLRAPPIPATTRRRWTARLAASARLLVLLLATSGAPELEAIATEVGVDATRRELVDGYVAATATVDGRGLATVAAQVHRLERGVRLM